MPDRILTLDIGTSSTKGLLIDAAGAVLAQRNIGYELRSPQPGFAEQDPDGILAAVQRILAELAPAATDLVLGCAMHSVIGVDGAGAALTPVLTWADNRSAAVADRLRRSASAAGLHRRTGTPLHPMSPLCKIRHLQDTDPGLCRRIVRYVSIKEYVLAALTGQWLVDHSVASATGLFDVASRDWDPEALEIAGITADRLSALVPTKHVVPFGDRRIVVGATDGVLANLGVGGADAELPCLTLGTSGAARIVVDRPATDPTGRLFCYVLDETRYVVGGAINNGGLVLRWLAELFGDPGATEDDVVRIAEDVPPGADGLLCVPTLQGERYPSYRIDGAANLFGLRPDHSRAHILRAGVEGMVLAFAPLIGDLEAAASGGAAAPQPFPEIRIGGGVFEWPFCRQLLADVVGRRLAMPESRESSALGGARLGFAALGQDRRWVQATPYVYQPDPQRHALYRELAARRRRLEEELCR